MKIHATSFFAHRRISRPCGFSLVEVLLSIFILGIGLIMVASVFPVGANWTRQTTEQSIAQNIAQNAIAVIQKHYGLTGDLHYSPTYTNGGPHALDPDFYIFPANGGPPTKNLANNNTLLQTSQNPFVLQPLPLFLAIPASERSYQFGNSNPFPAKNSQTCTYFWTAMAKLDASYARAVPSNANVQGDPLKVRDIRLSPSYKYDVFIFVFHKGSAEQVFPLNYPTSSIPPPGAEALFTRLDVNIPGAGPLETWMPSLYVIHPTTNYPNTLQTPTWNPLPVGWMGVGMSSGTVFHQIVGGTRPGFSLDVYGSGSPEDIIYSPPADGTSASPLIYIYQTSLTF